MNKALTILATIVMASALVHPAQGQVGPVTVGVMFPIKTMLGQQGRRGAELAADQLNASGGVLNGRPLKLIVYDDNFSPVEAVAAARRLVSEDKVSIMVGNINSAVALAVVQVAQQNSMLYFSSSAKAAGVTDYDRAFRFNPSVSVEGDVFNAYIRDRIKPNRLVVAVENGDYGRAVVADMKKAFGEKLVATELFDVLKQTDFSALATRIKSHAADVVCVGFSAPEQGANLLRSLTEAGVTARRCVLPGSVTPALLNVAGPALEGAFSMDIWDAMIPGEANRKFVQAFQAKYNEVPSKVDFLGYESMSILGQVIRKAGTATDTVKLATVTRQGEWESPRGTVRFPANQATAGAYVPLLVKDGKVQVGQ